jgi:multisubunit Na+/H+ antiporter MnhE subunit
MHEPGSFPGGAMAQALEARAFLEGQRKRHFRWMVLSGTFALLTIALALLGEPFAFGVVAVYFGFFSWNRRRELKRVEKWLSLPLPTSDRNATLWYEKIRQQLLHPPGWKIASECIGIVTAIVVVLTTQTLIFTQSGFWIRLLVIAALAVLMIRIVGAVLPRAAVPPEKRLD